jgi:SAM-dependent methyltransferase
MMGGLSELAYNKAVTACMPFQIPESPAAFLHSARELWVKLKEEKSKTVLPEGDWYPFDSLSCAPVVTELISRDFDVLAADIAGWPVADIGCADGDLAMLFAGWGAEVDAIDYAPNNFNGMLGVRTLGRLLGLPVRTYDINLDHDFKLPQDAYGLTLFLGTLYHLKNPYAVLEQLAFQTRWCILSTRIAQVTPTVRAPVESEPMAYLADGREIGNDATNYWVFSASGLFRILQRTRWAIVASQRIGCSVDSNPIDPDKDERMFVLLKSRVYFPELHVRLEEGWHPLEGTFRWTAKSFALEVVLPLEKPFSGFSLSIFVARQIAGVGRPIRLSCKIRDQLVGSAEYASGGSYEFAGKLPAFALHEPALRLNFTVESEFVSDESDGRELGICVPADSAREDRIGFRLLT